MNTHSIARAIGIATLVPLVAACGGGGDDSGDAPSANGATADQQAHTTMAVAPASGLYQLKWSIATTPTLSGHVVSDRTVMTDSPATAGPQSATHSAPRNLTQTLGLPTFAPTRILKDGKILVVPTTQQTTITTYVDGQVQVDTLADDGKTVGASQRRSGYTTVQLTGTLANAPADFSRWHAVFWENTTFFVTTTPFVAGAAYLKYTARNHGDRFVVNDCANPATSSASPTPCLTGTTLQAALAANQLPVTATSGTSKLVGGVPVWTAIAPLTPSGTPMHRVYFQLNGNVYMGHLIYDKAVISGNRWFQPGVGLIDLPFQLRLNRAAHDSLANAMAL